MRRRNLGDEASAGYLAMFNDPSTVMARIAIAPEWVAFVDSRPACHAHSVAFADLDVDLGQGTAN